MFFQGYQMLYFLVDAKKKSPNFARLDTLHLPLSTLFPSLGKWGRFSFTA